jgi:hypothetical protein
MEVIFVVMKKVTGVLLIAFSLAGCSSTPYYSDRKITTYNNHRPVSSVVDLVYNIGADSIHSIPKESRLEHEKCVYMILDNGNPGDACQWNTDTARGTVRVASIRPNLCHDLISTVTYKSKTVSWQDTACLTQNNKWMFYEK